ncbi:MAG: type II CAAX endopeptidase family protein [Bacillota bacterium]|nr:type II CAAX endopeptidase family protein [Bacillota bacterium]
MGEKVSACENKESLTETIAVIAVTAAVFIAFNKYRSTVAALPAIYMLIKKGIKHQSWKELGFDFKKMPTDIRKNVFLILLVGVVIPSLTFLFAEKVVPGFTEHVKSRLPMDLNGILPAVITAFVGTFVEEIIFRGFIQRRLEMYIKPVLAITAASLLFSFMHFSSGSFIIVALDIVGIFVDGIIYGVIFTRTKNIFASWTGHLLSDLVGIALLIF